MHEKITASGFAAAAPPARQRLRVRGRVQGVGFRPFVYRLARQMGLTGLVGNDSHGAFVEVQGPAEAVELFASRLQAELPPLARITDLQVTPLTAREETGFRIVTSATDDAQDAEITPDVATCDDCRRELFDPADRRYLYPFINCTNCGPRYSIILGVPYDRPNTTMVRFRMCPACQAEYDDPADRRFHAQPNACPACGPHVWLNEPQAPTATHENAIRRCAELLTGGGIVAIKGLGGFHLACRADDDNAVATLRERKGRESKPLAVMVANIETARELANVDAVAAAALQDVTRPIVLVPKREAPGQPRVSEHVAPGTDSLGLMLAYTPLHEVLFAEASCPAALVMTSGNPTEEPLCCDNDEALQRLSHIADAFLLHDRDIARRVDDSVVMTSDFNLEPSTPAQRRKDGPARCGSTELAEVRSHTMPIRRARGFAPAPIRVPVRADVPVLAVGAELKSTVCMLAGQTAIVSEHLGELANAEAYRNFVATIEQFQKLLRAEPAVIACDLHPDYAATRFAMRYAADRGLRTIGVQHHHAHMVSAMAEHGFTGRVLGICADGTGYGTDGAIWGCELLVGDEAMFKRVGHLRYFRLLGGDAAARETWRPAAGLLHEAFGETWRDAADGIFGRVPHEALDFAAVRLTGGARLPPTSSLGRLFDAVAFLLGLADENHHEAQAAMALEAAALSSARRLPGARRRARSIRRGSSASDAPLLTLDVETGEDGSGHPLQLDVRPTIRQVVEAVRDGADSGQLAWAFHDAVAEGLARAAVQETTRHGVDRVVLSGGCFANRLLTGLLVKRLEAAGLNVFVHRLVPTGDGGVSLGQAVSAAARL